MTRETPFARVLQARELLPGQMREIQLDNRTIVVGRLRSGPVVAFAALCPHEAARLVEGTLSGDQIDCSKHHYMWDVKTGENTFPLPIYPAWKRAQVGPLHLQTFPIIEEEGYILIDREAVGRT